MSNCPNKNAPEFKRLVQLTGLNPDEVSVAIGIWQDHNNSESWPSSAQIRSMYSNRQTYGGLDKYLAAISKPVEKQDIQQAVNNLPGRMQSILNAVGALVPGISAELHETPESYAREVAKVSSNVQAQKTNGFYNPVTKKIHLNLTRMVQTMSIDKKRALNTAEHEATHPILEVLETIAPGTIGRLFRSLQQVEVQLGYDGFYTVDFAGRYPITEQQEEAITEFIADVASGNLDLSKLNKTQVQKIADFFIQAFKAIGIDLSKYLNTVPEIISLAQSIQKSFDSGSSLLGSSPTEGVGGSRAINNIKFQADAEEEKIKQEAIKGKTFMLAPNGNKTNLSEKQWLQVRTRAFKNWFGDWEDNAQKASKVVDENGEPMVVYHGTLSKFNEFSKDKIGSNTQSNSSTMGFFFTSNKEAALSYASSNIERLNELKKRADIAESQIRKMLGGKTYLDFVYDELGGFNSKEYADFEKTTKAKELDKLTEEVDAANEFYELLADEWAAPIGEATKNTNIIPVFLNIRKPVNENYGGNNVMFDDGRFSKTIANAKKNGNDGVVIEDTFDLSDPTIDIGEDSHDVVVVFEPNQIKSAINNTGAFNPERNDIRFQLHPTQHTNITSLKASPGYKKAKSGDPASAKLVVENVYKQGKHDVLLKNSDAIILPIIAIESEGVNAIPLAYAEMVSAEYGNGVTTDIKVNNKPSHTNASAIARMMTPAMFTGKVERGKKYFIVDDVSTTGSTINEAKKYIQDKGGIVVGAGLLATAMGGLNISLKSLTIRKLYSKFGQQLNKILKSYGIADKIEDLTEQQGQYIFQKFNDAYGFRKRISKFRDTEAARIFSETPIQNQEKPDQDPKNLIFYTEKYPYMTKEGKNYVFFNYDSHDKSKLHTEPLPFMQDRGYRQKIVKVPVNKVYPLEEDPLELVKSQGGRIDHATISLLSSKGFEMIVSNANNKLVATPTADVFPKPSDINYKSIAVQDSNIYPGGPIDQITYDAGMDPEKLVPFRNYSIGLDNALKTYEITSDKQQFEKELTALIRDQKRKEEQMSEAIGLLMAADIEDLYGTNKEYRDLVDKKESATISEKGAATLESIEIKAAQDKKNNKILSDGSSITIFNDHESLDSSTYVLKNGSTRKILSVRKISPGKTEYVWHALDHDGPIYRTVVDENGKESTKQIENPIKFSLGHTDNSEDKQQPYEQALRFGRLVSDLTAKIKEGITDLPELRNIAGVDESTFEIFEEAYDLAWIRAGNNPGNNRQQGIYKMIQQLPEGDQRPTAQEMQRTWKPLLEELRISPEALKQILPDEQLLKDKSLNQTWKRILKVVDDVGAFVSQTIDRGKKFTLTDFETENAQQWDHAAIGFSDMLAYVENAVNSDPENKNKLLENVRTSLKSDPDNDMLKLLEVAIAASGETDLNNLSKIIRAGTLAGRVLNVIKRYIGGDNFGKIKADIAAATVMSDNDDMIATTKTGSEQDAISLLDLADEIRDILAISKMTTDERDAFFEENEDILDRLHSFLKGMGLSRGPRAQQDKRKIREAKTKISKGVASLVDTLRRTNPELIKFSKSDYDPELLKSIKQIVRGIIDIHGSDMDKLSSELKKTFEDNGILISVADILANQAIKDYINNVDRHKIREGVIREMDIDGDPYAKMILDNALKALNLPADAKNKKDRLIDALDRGELTKEILDTIKKEIGKMADINKRDALLKKIDEKFITIFNSAIPSKALGAVVSESLGVITRSIVSAYIADPNKSLSLLAANAMDQLGIDPDQAIAWASKVKDEVAKKLEKAKKAKIKSLLNQKISNRSKAESIEEKIFKIISLSATEEGQIPSATEIDGQMLDIKAVIAAKYGIKLNDPRAIAEIVKLTNLLRVARTSARRAQIYAKIMLKIRNMRLHPNRFVRVINSGLLELPAFVMANILSGINSAYKAGMAGFYNSARAYIQDAIIGRAVDWVYKTKDVTRSTIAALKQKKSKSPASHLMLTYALFEDVMRNGSAAISQSNIPEHGLTNFDSHLNNIFLLRFMYSPYRFLSAIDRSTMNLNHNRLAYRKAINNVIEFGRNNVTLNGQPYRRTAGGASWFMLDEMGTPKIDSLTGNIEVVRDPAIVKILNALAKENMTTTEFLGEVEELLGYSRMEQYYDEIIDEWNALVDLANSATASPEEKEELKTLGLHKQNMVKVNSMEDFLNMSAKIRRFVAQEIHKKVTEKMNAAIARDVHIETGGYSAQGIEIPGVPAGILYKFATILDNIIQAGMASDSTFIKFLTIGVAIPAKLYSFLITKAPAIGYGTALMFTPISFLMNLANLGVHLAGRPFMRITYDAKEKAWRYNGLTGRDISIATGIWGKDSNGKPKPLSGAQLLTTTNDDIIRVLKEGSTVISQDQNEFELKPAVLKTIGGEGGSIAIGTILAKQALSTAAFMTMLGLMFDCPEDEPCEMNEFGKKLIDIVRLKGYGAMKNWLDNKGYLQRYVGYRAVVDKFGDPHHQTVALSPQISELELKVPINELNNSVAATTLARVIDEMNSGVKLSRSDIALRYIIYSNFDLLADNMDISTDGLAEFKDVILASIDETYNRKKRINKASSSVAKRIMAALTPKMLNDIDKALLDKDNEHTLSIDAEGFVEQLKKKIPANIPFLRRYLKENDPQTYYDSPFQYEWTDWQLYIKKQKEPTAESFGLNTGKYNISPVGRITIDAPQGEVTKIKRNALLAGKGKDYVPNGWFDLAATFDSIFQNNVKESNINELIDAGKLEESLDLLKEIAKNVKDSPDFIHIKQQKTIKNEEQEDEGEPKPSVN